MKVKGYIELTVITDGLESTTVRQSISVNKIDLVSDTSGFNSVDKERLGIDPRAGALVSCVSICPEPCEVEETYEQVLALITEASE